MRRSIWGYAVEGLGIYPLLIGSLAGGVWSAVNGEGFEKGMDDAAEAVGRAVDKAADFADSHKDTINNAAGSVLIAVASQVAGAKAAEWSRPGDQKFIA